MMENDENDHQDVRLGIMTLLNYYVFQIISLHFCCHHGISIAPLHIRGSFQPHLEGLVSLCKAFG